MAAAFTRPPARKRKRPRADGAAAAGKAKAKAKPEPKPKAEAKPKPKAPRKKAPARPRPAPPVVSERALVAVAMSEAKTKAYRSAAKGGPTADALGVAQRKAAKERRKARRASTADGPGQWDQPEAHYSPTDTFSDVDLSGSSDSDDDGDDNDGEEASLVGSFKSIGRQPGVGGWAVTVERGVLFLPGREEMHVRDWRIDLDW